MNSLIEEVSEIAGDSVERQSLTETFKFLRDCIAIVFANPDRTFELPGSKNFTTALLLTVRAVRHRPGSQNALPSVSVCGQPTHLLYLFQTAGFLFSPQAPVKLPGAFSGIAPLPRFTRNWSRVIGSEQRDSRQKGRV